MLASLFGKKPPLFAIKEGIKKSIDKRHRIGNAFGISFYGAAGIGIIFTLALITNPVSLLFFLTSSQVTLVSGLVKAGSTILSGALSLFYLAANYWPVTLGLMACLPIGAGIKLVVKKHKKDAIKDIDEIYGELHKFDEDNAGDKKLNVTVGPSGKYGRELLIKWIGVTSKYDVTVKLSGNIDVDFLSKLRNAIYKKLPVLKFIELDDDVKEDVKEYVKGLNDEIAAKISASTHPQKHIVDMPPPTPIQKPEETLQRQERQDQASQKTLFSSLFGRFGSGERPGKEPEPLEPQEQDSKHGHHHGHG